MSKKLFVGNISWGTTEETLEKHFSEFGELEDVVVIKDKFSGRSRGFGFVTFKNAEDADKAIEALDGKEFEGRNINVNEAKPPTENRF